MRIRSCLIVAAGLVVVPAVPAAAHPGHESCAGGVPGVAATVPGVPGPGPAFGPFASGLAQSGQADETVTLIHEVYCEDHAPGE
jgi:hypothetical protein